MNRPLRERHALVTGATRGIGAAIAARLVADGARVTLLGRDKDALDRRAAELRVTNDTLALRADVTNQDEVAAAFREAARVMGPVEVLVNNAGAAASAHFGATDPALWQRMIDVNLGGTYHCTRAAIDPMLRAGWGRIINVASTAGLRGGRYVSAYTAAKHGVIGLTRALAIEYAAQGITVNAVCPGFTATDLLAGAVANVAARSGRTALEARAAILESSAQTRVIEPDEVARTVAWLASPEAGAITGQTIVIDASGTA